MNEINNKEDNNITKTVKLKDFCRDCCLELIYGDMQEYIALSSVLVNRPGLLLAGFDDYFGDGRVQIIGNAEHYYYQTMQQEKKEEILERLFSHKIPCLIYARNIYPDSLVLTIAEKHNVPVMLSSMTTTGINSKIAEYLNDVLAPTEFYHGTLLDIGGTGVLLTGDSGLGKSETALELIHRGHRLVADDAVEIKRVNHELRGTAPENIKFFMEVRGIGLIDVRSMYGVGSVLDSEDIHLVIELQPWNKNTQFDRLGNNEHTETILDINLPKLTIPVMPGRNLAVLVEVAVRHYRLKEFGYDAIKDLIERTNLKS